MAENIRKTAFIIGSVSHMDRINDAVTEYEKRGYYVMSVRPQPDRTKETLIFEAFYNIAAADLIVAVKKPDDSFGTGTLYELAFANYLSKHIEAY